MPSVDIHLDWLRYSVNWRDDMPMRENLESALPDFPCFQLTEKEARIGQGYNHGLELTHGMIFWHDRNKSQGISVQLSGLDLQASREAGNDELELLMALERKSATITTLHACINVHDARASPVDLITAHKKGELVTRARHIGQYSSETKGKTEWQAGDTIYIGSPKSAVQIRVYNKAAEQRIDGDWIRIEIVFRGLYAMAVFQAMCKYGIQSVTRQAIQKQVKVSAAWWVYAMRGGVSPPVLVKRKERGTVLWLKKSVAPALWNAIDEERKTGNDTLFEVFQAIIEAKKNRQ